MSVWAAGISAAVALGSAYMQSKSAKNATNAQIDAANAANQQQANLYNSQTNLMAPWRNAGASSIGYLSYLMGVPGYENWQPGDYMKGNSKKQPSLLGHVGQSGWNPVTGWGSKLWSTGGVLGGADGGLSAIGSAFGLSAPPKGSGDSSASTGPVDTPMGYAAPSRSSLPRFNSPYEAGFQQLPSGAQFIGSDGIVRRKH